MNEKLGEKQIENWLNEKSKKWSDNRPKNG